MKKIAKKNLLLFIIVLLTGLILRVFLAQTPVHTPDLNTFRIWSDTIIRFPLNKFYLVSDADYPPGYLYLLWFLGKVLYRLANYSIIIDPVLFYKLPAMLADLGTAVFIYLISRQYLKLVVSLILMAAFIFNPAILINSAFWGQMDSVVMLFLLGSVYALSKKNYWASAILLGICQSIKPVALLSLPIFLIYIFFREKSLIKLRNFSLLFILTVIILSAPFNYLNNFLEFFIKVNLILPNRWPLATLNAFNFWALTALPVNNGLLRDVSDQASFLFINFQNLGNLIFLGFYILVLCRFGKQLALYPKPYVLLIFALALSYFGMFLFLTRMHERHLYYTLPFILLLIPLLPNLLKWLYSLLFVCYFLNLYYALRLILDNPLYLPASLIIAVILFEISLFFTLLYNMLSAIKIKK